jgi:hypothetical protein
MPSRGSRISENPELPSLIVFPAHALLMLEERLAEQEAEGVEMPEGMERDELALRILVVSQLDRSAKRRSATTHQMASTTPKGHAPERNP